LRQRTVPYFVGREEELKSLHGFLSDGESVAISAVSGMGGIGKSELALQYIYRSQAAYPDGILWLDATSATFAEEIIGFAVGTLKLSVPEDLPPVQKVRSVWAHWLGTDPVLVVVDNINQPEDFTRVQEFLPYGYQRFRVLVTSRVKLAGLRELPLDLLPLKQAVKLLARLAKASERKNWDRKAAKNLCKRLGRLPLAVALVGSYLGLDLNLGLAEMTALLEKKGLDARCLDKPDPTVAKRGVKAAFDLSWEHLTAETQRLACVLAMFARAPIEWRLVENTFISTDSEEAPQFDRFDLTDWRQELLRYSLLQGVELAEQGRSGYLLHPLIWEYLRQKIPTVLDEQIRRSMVKAIITEAETIEYNAPLADYEKVRLSIPHITELAEEWTELLNQDDVITPSTRIAFYYLCRLFDIEGSEYWFQKTIALAKKLLPKNHMDIVGALNNLAEFYSKQGRYQRALSIYSECFEFKNLNKKPALLAILQNNQALVHVGLGEFSKAEVLYRKAMEIERKHLSEDDPSLANSLINLADLLSKHLEQTIEAESLYSEALEIARKSLPKNHPSLANIIFKVAEFYESKGDFLIAETHFLEAIVIARESFSRNHPNFAAMLNNVAMMYIKLNKISKAKPLLQESLRIIRLRYGDGHHLTLTILENYEAIL
jgi:tetratricopeptide (TPR) repeat protein